MAMFDPLVELHPADENNNVEMGAVGRIFRSIAMQAHCAVMVVHHTRKPSTGDSTGHIGNMDSARGGGSLVGVTRIGATLYTIDDKTAVAYGVTPEDRHRYVRFDNGKNNMALGSGEPVFFRREGVNIGTFDEPEEVGVLRPIVLEKRRPKAELEAEDLRNNLEALLAPGEAMGTPEIARKLIDIDPVLYGDDHRVVARKIARHHEKGKLPGFEIEKEAGRRGSKITRELETRQEKT